MKFTASALTFFLLIFTSTSFAQWNQIGLDIDGEDGDNYSGVSVSLSSDGHTIAIGAHRNDGTGVQAGHVRIYTWNGSSWIQKGADIDGEVLGDFSGESISMSTDGNVVAIGATGNGANGHVRVFEWNGSSWIQNGIDIDGNGTGGDNFGKYVNLNSSGTILAIGAPSNDQNGADAGQVQVFEWNGTAWTQKGANINGEGPLDYSGHVTLDSTGNTLAVGAPNNNGNGTDSGHTRVFEWNGTAWNQKGIDIDGEAAGDNSGEAVSLSYDGTILAIGAPDNDDPTSLSGHVRIFEWSGSTWLQKGADIDGEATNDRSGSTVNLNANGSTVAIGSIRNEGNGIFAGHVRIFEWNGSGWIQKGIDIDSEFAGDRAGSSVYLSSTGNTVAVGAQENDDNGNNSNFTGHVRIFEYCTIDTSVTLSGATLTANSTGSTYKWLDCNDNYTWVTGETNQIFSPPVNGSYAVEITKGNCIDTTACYTIGDVSAITLDFQKSINIYPNPTSSNQITISLGAMYTNIQIDLTTVYGKLIKTHFFESAESIDIDIDGANGVYLVKIKTEVGKTAVLRVLQASDNN